MTSAKHTLFILAALSTLTAFSVHAENHLLLMGGGGEPVGETTIFDSGIKRFSPNLKNSSWKYDVSFNGGHKQTEEILNSQFNRAQTKTSFTIDQYKALIENYKAKILLGDIKKGDQLMIIIDTHGAVNNGGQTTHQIAAIGKTAKDLNRLSDAELVSLDSLAELVKLTNERGITMGIVDLSCHSGSSLKLKSPNTCVVTATGPKHYGFAGGNSFSDVFLANLAPGTTMEQAFLKARASTDDASYPMISTDEHESIAREVYSSITPYLYYYDPKADKISDYLISASKDQVICQRDVQFESLIKKIEVLNSIIPSGKTNQLKNLLADYKKSQDQIIAKIKNLGGEWMEKKETITTPVPGSKKPISWDYNYKTIIETNADSLIKTFEEKAAREKNKSEQAYLLAVAENYRKLKNKKDTLLSRFPKIKDYEKESKELVKAMGENRNRVELIAKEERKFYDELYRNKQSLNFNDPCRKLTF